MISLSGYISVAAILMPELKEACRSGSVAVN
jgi:hypothetical protein